MKDILATWLGFDQLACFFSWFYIFLSSGHQFLHILCFLTLVSLTWHLKFYLDSFSFVFRALPLTAKPTPNWWWHPLCKAPLPAQTSSSGTLPSITGEVSSEENIPGSSLCIFFPMAGLWSCLSGLSSLLPNTHILKLGNENDSSTPSQDFV